MTSAFAGREEPAVHGATLLVGSQPMTGYLDASTPMA
jgi:hypothetical protein